jgi:hypothetical protein
MGRSVEEAVVIFAFSKHARPLAEARFLVTLIKVRS